MTLLQWFRENARDLPWRQTRDPYAVWLSEIILQQTRTEQGRPYWERFMRRWPTVEQLARATEDEVLREWQGLGYYSRARNLHTAARQVVAQGGWPRTIDGLRKLKGVGDYTAAAIGSIAFGLPAAVVDGNVYRVLARHYGIATPINTTAGKHEFAALAQSLLPPSPPFEGGGSGGAIEAGLAMPTDQYKLRVKQNESQLNRKKLTDGITLLKMALAQYIGADVQTMVLTDTLGLETEPTAYYHHVEEAVAQRHESHLLDLSMRAEDLKKKMTLGEALPSLLVGGSVNYHTVMENTKPNAMVFAMLQVPLTDWHKTSIKLKKHNLDAEMAENTRRDLTEKMQLQTNQAWFNLEQSWLRITMAQTALSDAEANLKITEDYYDAGLVALSDVLEAQTLLKQSRDELTDSRVEYHINLVKYKQLTGY